MAQLVSWRCSGGSIKKVCHIATQAVEKQCLPVDWLPNDEIRHGINVIE